MPELPEVETVARTLLPHVCNRRISGVRLLRASTRHPLSLPFETLIGRGISTVRRRGKLLLLQLAPQACGMMNQGIPSMIVVHLRMTGSLLPRAADAQPGAHTRCCFDLRAPDGQASRLFFDDIRAFGQIFVANPATLSRWAFWRELGPEPLCLDDAGFAAVLANRHAALKAVLLNQRAMAGIGNIYADESLFRACLDPRHKAADLLPEQRSRLLRAIRDVLNRAIEQCGTSVRNYRDANGRAGAFQNTLAVYGKAGSPCPRCGTPLARIRVAGRGTVFCPHCQR